MIHARNRVRTRIIPWLQAHRWQLLVLFIGVLVPLWVFGELADEVLEREEFWFDVPILLWMRSISNPLLDRVMLFASLLGYQYGVIPINIVVLLVLLKQQRWGDTLFWCLAIGGAALLNLIAKSAFGRIRPDLWLSLAPESTLSFPSGHAMGSMALVTSLVVLFWPTRWRWPVLIAGAFFVLIVGVSRMYLGVHFPSDILAGWAAALAWVIGVSIVLYGRFAKATPYTNPTV